MNKLTLSPVLAAAAVAVLAFASPAAADDADPAPTPTQHTDADVRPDDPDFVATPPCGCVTVDLGNPEADTSPAPPTGSTPDLGNQDADAQPDPEYRAPSRSAPARHSVSATARPFAAGFVGGVWLGLA
jgi:hypothetical protein